MAHELALEAFYAIFSVQYRPNRGNRGIHVISTFRVKSKHSITNRTLAHAWIFVLEYIYIHVYTHLCTLEYYHGTTADHNLALDL